MQDKLSTLSLPEARLARILRCTASDVLRWAGLYEQATAETDAIGFGMRRVQAEQTLLHEGQRFENVYLVGGGSFKHVQTDLEGYEQVLGFATHGDMLGLDGLGRDRHASGAVALEDSSVVVLPFGELLALLAIWLEEANQRGFAAAPLISDLVTLRQTLRKDSQWALADQVRTMLDGHNVVVEDSRDGSSWRWAQ